MTTIAIIAPNKKCPHRKVGPLKDPNNHSITDFKLCEIGQIFKYFQDLLHPQCQCHGGGYLSEVSSQRAIDGGAQATQGRTQGLKGARKTRYLNLAESLGYNCELRVVSASGTSNKVPEFRTLLVLA